MITSLSEFIDRCIGLDTFDIVELWNDEVSIELMEIIENFADPRSPEPLRSAMYNIGFTEF